MRTRLPVLLSLAAGFAVAGAFLLAPAAHGDAASELAAAVKKGEEIWKKPFVAGQKACAACHTGGANAMKGTRLKTYPKFDNTWRKVISVQQKLNQMIKDKAGGTPLELGSDDLNALEAFISTLK